MVPHDWGNKTSAWTNQTLVCMNCTCYLDPPCVADEFQPGRLGLFLVTELAGCTLQHHSEAKERQSDVAEGRLHAAKRRGHGQVGAGDRDENLRRVGGVRRGQSRWGGGGILRHLRGVGRNLGGVRRNFRSIGRNVGGICRNFGCIGRCICEYDLSIGWRGRWYLRRGGWGI